MSRPSIFLCHSSKNKPFVRKLVDRLNNDGIDTWFDEIEIKIGEEIHTKINEGLRKSDFFAIVLSNESVKSKWVENELNSASAFEKYANRGVFVLPILIEQCDVPPLLLDRRYANFVEDFENAYKEITDSIFYHFRKKYPECDLDSIKPITDDHDIISEVIKNNIDIELLSPREFEELIAQLFNKLGYNVELTSMARDGGMDIIAKKEITKGMKPYSVIIDCKKYSKDNLVGASIVRNLLGTMFINKADRGVLVTSSQFTREAMRIATNQPLELIDRLRLYELLRLS